MKHLIGVGEMKIEFSKTSNWGQKYCWQFKGFRSFLCITVVGVTRLACLLPPPFCLFICYCLGLCYILTFLCTYCKKSVHKYPVCLCDSWFLWQLVRNQLSCWLLFRYYTLRTRCSGCLHNCSHEIPANHPSGVLNKNLRRKNVMWANKTCNTKLYPHSDSACHMSTVIIKMATLQIVPKKEWGKFSLSLSGLAVQ